MNGKPSCASLYAVLVSATMEKDRAIKHFGSVLSLAQAIGIKHQAIYDWPEDLPPRLADRVISAAVRAGQMPPPWMLKRTRPD